MGAMIPSGRSRRRAAASRRKEIQRESRHRHRQDPQAGRHRVPHRLPRQPDHRGGRRGGHSHDHRAAGAGRPAHGRRGEPRVVGTAHRRLRHAARPRHRELLRRRGPGVRRLGADRGAAARLAEPLEAPVTTSLQGKSAFPENHPLSLGSGGRSISKQLHHFLNQADMIFGIGCSFSITNYGVAMPKGKKIAHATLDPTDINKDVPADLALVGDAALTLEALLLEVRDRLKGKPRGRLGAVTQEIAALKQEWLAQWMPRLTQKTTPLSPYRVLWDLMHTVDVANTIITHDAGSPRDQISPFWEPTAPLTYIGWGKTTQLGYGLGLAMGAKLARPDKLCINVWGDAAIGFTGMDFETCVRERIPIMSVLLNNFSMAIELKIMKT